MAEATHDDSSAGFYPTYQAMTACLRKVHSLRHVPREKLVQFCMDICVVACGIRWGYLFDAFGVRDKRKTIKEVLADCVNLLRKDVPRFHAVCLVHEPASDQLFFVNTNQLLSRTSSSTGSSHSRTIEDIMSSTSFVEVKGSSAKTCTPPPGLQLLLGELQSRLDGDQQQVVTLPEDERTQDLGTMVAFAACILEFPVAYVPTFDSGGGAFLAGVALDVYECILEADVSTGHDLPGTHVMLKFSCPHAVATTRPELHAESVISRLHLDFEERLVKVAFPGRMIVRHSVETLDRVAL